MFKNFTVAFFTFISLFSLFFLSCTSLEPGPHHRAKLNAPELPKDPTETPSTRASLFPKRELASSGPLVTYCTTETAEASTPEEKKWREAFSLEVMERICNKEPEVAKPWRSSKYLETSWAHGLNLTGVDNGVPRGTAITPRHVIYTKHYGFHGQVGQNIWFLTLDNRWISRKIIEVKYLDTADVAIARLETDLPGSIMPLRVLDPQAFNLVPDLVPVLRIQQQNKALLVEKRGLGMWRPNGSYGTFLTNPPERAFAQYYQDMVRFDSSSPSILILRNEYGVMPVLYSLVTFGGVGSGPMIHQLISEIQNTIASFGDSHQLVKAMPPIAPFAAPSCSVSVSRIADGNTCKLVVKGSADPVTGNPVVLPQAPSSWTVRGNTWTGNVTCPDDPSTFFEATLTGPGGTGRSCESGVIGPLLPLCTLSVSRRASSEICDVSVTRRTGNPTQNPILFPSNPSDWQRSGDVWTGTTSCSLNTKTDFSAKLSDEVGTGPECKTTLEVHPEIPTCEISSQRLGYSDSCEVVVTRKSGVATGNPNLFPVNPSNWIRNGDQYTGSVNCSTETYSTFSAALTGPLGTGPLCRSTSTLSVPEEVPFCELQASRLGLTNVCKLNINLTRGRMISPPPVATPRNPVDWKQLGNTSNYEGTVGCSYNGTHQFSAYYPGFPNVIGRVCQAPLVDVIPAPACNLQVSRQTTTNVCNYTLSAGSEAGTIASYNFDGGTSRTAWDGLSPVSGTFTCSQIANTRLTAFVWGPGGRPQTSSCRAGVPRLEPPSCQLTAQRRKRTSTCDLTLTEGGVIDLKKLPPIKPKGSWTSRNGNTRKGTGACPTNRATTFTATVFGPGGSQAVCSSNTVPKL